jgi:hypothetical protein
LRDAENEAEYIFMHEASYCQQNWSVLLLYPHMRSKWNTFHHVRGFWYILR